MSLVRQPECTGEQKHMSDYAVLGQTSPGGLEVATVSTRPAYAQTAALSGYRERARQPENP